MTIAHLLLAATSSLVVATLSAQTPDKARWTSEAARVTIVRDDWGIAHIHGKSDADAVFGMIYAQCEDDFNRVETNYLTSLGRTAEAEGETKIWQDLRQRLFIDPEDLKKDYKESPAWLKKLMDAWADGINFYLANHPEVKPKVLTHFEPWMALSFTEGSIGGDIERVNLAKLEAFYSKPATLTATAERNYRSCSQTMGAPSQSASSIEVGCGNTATCTQTPGAPSQSASSIEVGCGNSATCTQTPGAPSQSASSIEVGCDNAALEQPTQSSDANTLAFLAERSGDTEPRGSNGIAIAPSNTTDHHALLLINPHTSFFFRSELQMSSDEGLNAYGAVTWGQFFIYQGFNERAGWMHTSSGVDAVDEFQETVSKDGIFQYKYGSESRPFATKAVTIAYKSPNGIAQRTFTTYFSTHGPVTHEDNGKWVTMKLMNIPIPALEQSYLRTKAHNYKEYSKTMELKANSSNNTIFADADGDIAYWHGNFIPKRDPGFDFTRPVDGSDPATDWHGLMTLDEIPHLLNPSSGYLFNVNNAPWWGAGESSLKKSDFPAYVEMGSESERGIHAIMLLKNKKDFTLDSLMTSAYDSYMPWFDKPIPALTKAWATLPFSDPLKQSTGPEVAALRGWSRRWSAASQATSLAIYWGQALQRSLGADARKAGIPVEQYAGTQATAEQLLTTLKEASNKLTADFGTWNISWGQINRFQRLTGDIVQPFNDAAPSIPVPFASSVWGSLASFGARQYPGTKKWYGTSGNSFVAVVEFGPKVRARAVTAGGESGHPESRHFDDEAERYASGNLREVYFYPDQLTGHTERTYRPGQ